MTARTRNTVLAYRLGALLCVTLLVVAAALWWFDRHSAGTKVTAYFGQAVGVYPGSDVRVLGLKVGSIDAVVPEGTQVRVDMTVDSGVEIPAAASAVVIAPSLVSDRYVQFTPVYTGGPALASGAVVPRSRTATPVEVDDLSRSLEQLSSALGPNGANKNGALSNALDTGAQNLAGNGQSLGATLEKLSGLASTLDKSKGDLFGTVDGLAQFTKTLATSDEQLRTVSGQLADVTGFLADERQNLGTALGSLAGALGEVRDFITSNRGQIQSNVAKMTGITRALADQRAALAEVLDVAPLAASNAVNTYDPVSGTVQVRANLNELTGPPVLMVCRLLRQSSPAQIPQVLSDACQKLAPVLDGTLKLPSVAETLRGIQQGKLPPLPLVESANPPAGGGR